MKQRRPSDIRPYRASGRERLEKLAEFLESLPPGRERRYYGRLVADSYFLNGDYQAALGVYESLLNEQPDPAERTELLLQLADTLSRELRYADAAQRLDERPLADETDALRRWSAEWRLASAMTRAGQIELRDRRKEH